MELVPIILNILEVVAGLTILTLIISYISFKSKEKNSLPNKERSNKSNLNSNIRNNAKLQNKLNDDNRKAIISQSANHIKDEKSYSSKNVQSTPHKKVNTPDPKVRLEVLNQLSTDPAKKEGINKEESKNRTDENLKSLNDDVFDKYSDNSKQEMFTLHVKDKKDKSKEK